MYGVNLVPGYHKTTRKRRVRTHRWTMGVIGYGLVLLIGWATLHFVSGGAHRAVASQLQETESRIADTQDAIANLQPRLKESLATLAAGRSIGEQPNWSILLRLVGDLLGDRAVLTRCYLEPADSNKAPHTISTRYVLHLEGLAQSHQTVSDFVLALEGLDLFTSVTMTSTQREPWDAKTAIAFRLDCVLGGALDE